MELTLDLEQEADGRWIAEVRNSPYQVEFQAMRNSPGAPCIPSNCRHSKGGATAKRRLFSTLHGHEK
jgi:hypothetical protein